VRLLSRSTRTKAVLLLKFSCSGSMAQNLRIRKMCPCNGPGILIQDVFEPRKHGHSRRAEHDGPVTTGRPDLLYFTCVSTANRSSCHSIGLLSQSKHIQACYLCLRPRDLPFAMSTCYCQFHQRFRRLSKKVYSRASSAPGRTSTTLPICERKVTRAKSRTRHSIPASRHTRRPQGNEKERPD
jgi:hypothetical protein